MKELFLIRDSLTNKISYYHLMLLLVSLPFDLFYSHIIVISFIVHTLIHLDRQHFKSVFNFRVLILQSVFLVTVVSTIYTINRPEAFIEWGRQFLILLMPVVLSFNAINIRKYRANLLLIFSITCTITIVYLYFDAIRTIKYYSLPLKMLITEAFTNHNFSEPIGMHATFFSLQLVIALVFLISLLFSRQSVYRKLFYMACCGLLSAGLIQLGSKTILFSTLLIINLLIPYFLLSETKRRKFMVTSISLSMLLLVGIFAQSSLRERYVNALSLDLSKRNPNETSDPRLGRWEVIAGLIKKSPVKGYGAGSEIGLLHPAFFDHKYYSAFLNKLNAHNEYLSMWLKSGIIGLMVYLATLAFGLRMALAKKDLLFLTFILLIAMVSLSENLLDVDKGVIFYAVFFGVFVFSNNPDNIEKIRVSAPVILLQAATNELVTTC